MSSATRRTMQLFAVAAALLLALPLVSRAQTAPPSSDLRSTIRAELLSDPRTSNVPAAELEAMVSALASQAAAQGITPQQIIWRPDSVKQALAAAAPAPACASGNYLCAINTAFGFQGSATLLPFVLGALAAVLIIVLALMLELHKRSRSAPPAPPAASA